MVRWLSLFLFLFSSYTTAGAQTLHVEPRDALADTEMSIEVSCLESGQIVVGRLAMGGSYEGTRRSQDTWPEIISFLNGKIK